MKEKKVHEKQTKIIATVSDLKCEQDFIRQLFEAGVNVIRMNTAHQTPEDTLRIVNNIRAVSEEIAILIDTKGPEMRTSGIDKSIMLEQGQSVRIVRDTDSVSDDAFCVTYDKFIDEIPLDSDILIDDGTVHLKVIEKKDDELVCKSVDGGKVSNKKSVNVPGVHTHLPSLTPKDIEYVNFAIEHDIDFIAHSFVRNRDDIMAIQSILDSHNSPVKIIAKIENQEGVDNLDQILDCAFGVMIARGDMGIEIAAEEVPLIQKRMIAECITRAKPVITATQMMHSMIENARPTRAEVSDVANAVLDGTDALMLSGETAFGKYPIESVEAMVRIARAAEMQTSDVRDHPFYSDVELHTISNYMAMNAVHAALDLNAKVILSDTATGFSSRVVSSYRGRIPVCASTHDKRVVRELAVSYGIVPAYSEEADNTDELVGNALKMLLARGVVGEDDLVLILASTPGKLQGTNLIEFNTPRGVLSERD